MIEGKQLNDEIERSRDHALQIEENGQIEGGARVICLRAFLKFE
jgi:hypothetical protein